MQIKTLQINKFTPVIFLLFLTIAYLPVLLPYFHIKNDLITQNLPTRFFVGESLYSNTFPWWNPYINFGLPQYGDMNHGFWNPFLWIIGKIFGYNVLSITLEEMLYIFIGGWGIYEVSKQFSIQTHIAIICGLSYMSGGYILGHLQHFCWITGTAFFPYVLLFFTKSIVKPTLKNFLLGGLCSFFFVSSAHPGFIIGGLYFFLFVLLYLLLITNFTLHRSKYFILKVSLLYGLFIIVLSPIVWVSDLDVIQHITRGTKVPITESLKDPTTLQCYLSLFFPLSINKGNFFNTDISMRNTSIVIFVLVGVFFFFKKFSSKLTFPIAGMLLFFILLASGGIFKVLVYHFLPLLGFVRLNGEFSYFSFLILIIIGGIGLSANNILVRNNLFLKASRPLLFLFIISTIVSFTILIKTKNSVWFSDVSSLSALVHKLSFWDLLLISSLIQSTFIILYKKYLLNKDYLLIITALNLIIITWLCLPFTGLSKIPRSEVQAIINSRPKGIIMPSQKAINTNTYIDAKYDSIIGSAAFYSKQIGYPEQPSYPIVLNSTENFYRDSSVFSFIKKQSYLFLSADTIKNVATDYAPSSIQILNYSPTLIRTKVNNQKFRFLILLQNNYPYWKVLVDGNAIEHFTAFKTFIGIPIPKGIHEVTFKFEAKFLKVIVWINVVLVIIALALIINKKTSMVELVKNEHI